MDEPRRRARMGRAGRARVECRFTWRAVAAQTAVCYTEAITAHRAAAAYPVVGATAPASEESPC
jgi:hypothetical protein